MPGNQCTWRKWILKEGSFTLHHLLKGGGQRFLEVEEEHLKGTEIADRMVPQEPSRSVQSGAEYPQGWFLWFYCWFLFYSFPFSFTNAMSNDFHVFLKIILYLEAIAVNYVTS